MRRLSIGAVLGVLALAGCSVSDDGPTTEQAGALAAARVYVDAIADLDVATADAMTDPESFPSPDSRDVDVRSALPEAVDPITDPWIALAGTPREGSLAAREYVVQVSYSVRELTGGATIALTLDGGGDPDDVSDWTVTTPLILQAPTYADDDVVETALLGGVELTYGESSHQGVWGYPGGYLLEPADPVAGIEPLWVPVGAADLPPWNGSLPMLEKPED